MDINLGWTYLKHDIDQWTWRLGDMRKEDPGERFSSQSDDNESDDTFIRRKIEEAVATLAHKYVVWFVLWNWCLIYFEELSVKLEEELKGIASMIEETAYSRKAPRKCKRKPFKDIDDVIVDDVIIETGEI